MTEDNQRPYMGPDRRSGKVIDLTGPLDSRAGIAQSLGIAMMKNYSSIIRLFENKVATAEQNGDKEMVTKIQNKLDEFRLKAEGAEEMFAHMVGHEPVPSYEFFVMNNSRGLVDLDSGNTVD